MRNNVVRATVLVALLLWAPACKLSEAATKPVSPPGEVWLTTEQVRARDIDVQPAEMRDVDDAIVTSARVTFDDMRVAHVFSPVTGRVAGIAAQLGQRVKRGDVLATVESPDVGNALSDANKARADFIAAEHDYRRQNALASEGAASQAVLEQSEDGMRRARAELERARSRAYLLRAGDGQSVSQTHTLVSPIDGEVVARNVNPGIEIEGQYAGGAAQELFTIGQLDEVWVVGDIYEVDVGRVRVGAPVTVTVVTSGAVARTGAVDWVSSVLDPDTRTAKVRCRLSNTDHALRPEMFATLSVAVDRRRVLAVPAVAVLQLGEYHVVFVEVAEENTRMRFARVPVDVEDASGDGASTASGAWIAIRHGLEPGQRVVVQGADRLSPML